MTTRGTTESGTTTHNGTASLAEASTDESVAIPSTPKSPSRARAILQVAGIFLLFTIVAGVVIAPKAFGVHEYSPVDEVTYSDYLHKVLNGNLTVGQGEPEDGWTVRETLCRGILVIGPGPNSAACGEPVPPPSGVNTADIDPPTYYWITAAVAKAIMSVGITDDLLVAGRLAGILWAGLSMTAVFLFARRISASKFAAATAAFSLLGVPLFVDQFRFITPHATDFLIGCFVAWVGLKADRGQASWWLLVLAGLSTTVFKASNVMIAIFVALFLVVAGLVRRHKDPLQAKLRALIPAGWLIAGLLAGTIGFLVLRESLKVTNNIPFPQFVVPSLYDTVWLQNVANFAITPGLDQSKQLSLIFNLMLYGMVAVAISRYQRDRALSLLSGSLVVGVIVGPIIFVLMNYVLTSTYVVIPARYGLSITAALVAVMASQLRSKLLTACLAVVVIGLIVIGFRWDLIAHSF